MYLRKFATPKNGIPSVFLLPSIQYSVRNWLNVLLFPSYWYKLSGIYLLCLINNSSMLKTTMKSRQ
jgi:hypothetical protein